MPQADNPCPFCGFTTIEVVPAHSATDSDLYQVICDNCGACGPTYSSQEDAITGWNTGISHYSRSQAPEYKA